MSAVRILKYALLVVAGIGILSYLVMHLWNWILPASAGWNPISYWQAMGLLVLSKILFSGWGNGKSKWKQSQWKSKMKEKWNNMSEDEREKFKDLLSPCDRKTKESNPE